MKYLHKQSVTLSVSNKNLNCNEITQALIHSRIASSVTSNTSIQLKNGVAIKENGCRIVFNSIDKDQLGLFWGDLKEKHKLKCGHLDVPSSYSGCIIGYLNNKGCPYN